VIERIYQHPISRKKAAECIPQPSCFCTDSAQAAHLASRPWTRLASSRIARVRSLRMASVSLPTSFSMCCAFFSASASTLQVPKRQHSSASLPCDAAHEWSHNHVSHPEQHAIAHRACHRVVTPCALHAHFPR